MDAPTFIEHPRIAFVTDDDALIMRRLMAAKPSGVFVNFCTSCSIGAEAYSRSFARGATFVITLFRDDTTRIAEFQRRAGDRGVFMEARRAWLAGVSDLLRSMPRCSPILVPRASPTMPEALRHVVEMASSAFLDVQCEGLSELVDMAHVRENLPILYEARVDRLFAHAIESSDADAQRLGMAGLLHMDAAMPARKERLDALALSAVGVNRILVNQLIRSVHARLRYSI